MTYTDAIKRIFSLGLPMAGTQLIHVASGFLCMTMLAQLGHEVLAASALIYSIQLAVLVTGISFLFSISILVSHANGAHRYLSIGNYVQQGWLMAILISIPTIILFWHIKSVLIFAGQDPHIATIVQTFFHAFIWAVIPNTLSACNQQFCYGVHRKAIVICGSVLGIGVLLITAYTLIFGKFGFPALGVAGLGYAQTAQFSFFFIFTTLICYFNKSFAAYKLFTFRVHQHLDHFKQMFKIGGPIFMQMGGEISSFAVFGLMTGWIGKTALAASQITNQFYSLAIIPLFVFSQAGGILMGQVNGAKQFNAIKPLGYASLSVVLAISVCITSVFIFFPKYLAQAYIDIHNPDNQEILHYALLLFSISGVTLLLDSLRNMLIGLCRGLFDTKTPMIIGILLIWGFDLPLSYVLAFKFHWGLFGIALSGPITMLLGSCIMFYRWHKLSNTFFYENNA